MLPVAKKKDNKRIILQRDEMKENGTSERRREWDVGNKIRSSNPNRIPKSVRYALLEIQIRKNLILGNKKKKHKL